MIAGVTMLLSRRAAWPNRLDNFAVALGIPETIYGWSSRDAMKIVSAWNQRSLAGRVSAGYWQIVSLGRFW